MLIKCYPFLTIEQCNTEKFHHEFNYKCVHTPKIYAIKAHIACDFFQFGVDDTLCIWLVIQFRQRYGHVAFRKPRKIGSFWVGRTLRPDASTNLFSISSKSSPDWLVVGRLSDFDDVYITFHQTEDGVLLKIRLWAQTQTILEGVLFRYALTNMNIARIISLMTWCLM